MTKIIRRTYLCIESSWVLSRVVLSRAARLPFSQRDELASFDTVSQAYEYYHGLPSSDTRGYCINIFYRTVDTGMVYERGFYCPEVLEM